MIYLLYVLLSIILVLLEILLPLFITPVAIPFGYFIHIYGFVMHGKFKKVVGKISVLNTSGNQIPRTKS